MPAPSDKPLARCLGEFVGHILRGVRTDVSPRQVVRHKVEEVRRDTADEEVTLRRTIIEEVRITPKESAR